MNAFPLLDRDHASTAAWSNVAPGLAGMRTKASLNQIVVLEGLERSQPMIARLVSTMRIRSV
jgi:hypothetical protein